MFLYFGILFMKYDMDRWRDIEVRGRKEEVLNKYNIVYLFNEVFK